MSTIAPERIRAAARVGIACYVVVTALGIAVALALDGPLGSGGRRLPLLLEGPHSDLRATLVSATFAWLLFGSALVLAATRRVRREGLVACAAFYLLAFVYLGFVRERVEFGDVADYVRAAFDLHLGRPLHARYPYPPLWATCLQPFARFGADTVFVVCVAGNVLSLLLLIVLLQRALARYGFSTSAAAATTFALLVANVPVLRNLGYAQINLHILNLVLLCLLFAPRHALLSALALALAVHMKVSPGILALPFILGRRWRWLGWFALSIAGVVALTSAMNGFHRYGEFWENFAHPFERERHPYRDVSLDSLVLNTFRVLGGEVATARTVLRVLKPVVGAACLWVLARCIRNRTFSGRAAAPAEAVVLEGFVALPFLMTLSGPLFWSHHMVFLLLPFAAMVKRVARASDVLLLSAAWFLVFLTPALDSYPFSYHKLAGVLLALGLLFRLSGRAGGEDARWTRWTGASGSEAPAAPPRKA